MLELSDSDLFLLFGINKIAGRPLPYYNGQIGHCTHLFYSPQFYLYPANTFWNYKHEVHDRVLGHVDQVLDEDFLSQLLNVRDEECNEQVDHGDGS